MKLREKQKISPLMKTLVIIEVIAVLLLLLLSAYKHNLGGITALLDEKKPDVILDAGHGGYDAGAISDTMQEKDISLAMVKEIGAVLEAKGYKVAYTRDSDKVDWASDEKTDVQYRVKTVNESKAKLMVSIHVNSEEIDQNSYGYEIWGKLKQDHVFSLAKHILDNVSSLAYSQNRGMKDQDTSTIYILQHASIPSVLFEVGFIKSVQDQAYMKEGEARRLFCEKTANGIIETLEEIKKAEKAKT